MIIITYQSVGTFTTLVVLNTQRIQSLKQENLENVLGAFDGHFGIEQKQLLVCIRFRSDIKFLSWSHENETLMRKEFKVVSNTFTVDFPSIVFLSELSFPFSIPNNPPTEFQMKKKFILIYFHLIKIYVNPHNILSLFLFHWSFSFSLHKGGLYSIEYP